jgi:hypothetical protein
MFSRRLVGPQRVTMYNFQKKPEKKTTNYIPSTYINTKAIFPQFYPKVTTKTIFEQNKT